jgi:endonuclease I/V8-like Glu-specific endopeptidase
MAQVNEAFLSSIAAATARYEERADERAATAAALSTGGILAADDATHIAKRLARLNAGWSLAEAIDRSTPGPTTGRSLAGTVPPELFDTNVLGLERLMGRNDLIDVMFLQRGAMAARSVGRISVRSPRGSGYGTGFLVSPRLLLTNHHVLGDAGEAAASYVEFDYQSGLDGMPLSPKAFTFDPGAFFLSSPADQLDFTLVAVAPTGTHGEPLGAFGFLELIEQDGKVVLGELVDVIQHPNGEPKQLALRQNKVVDRLERFLHYETDTAPGSSGSPVFNDQWELVALHHSGVPKVDAKGDFVAIDGTPWTPDMGEERLAWIANEGVRISRIIKAVRDAVLTGEAAQMRIELFASAAPGAVAAPESGGPPAGSSVVAGAAAPSPSGPSTRFSVPLVLDVAVTLGPTGVSAASATPPAPAAPGPPPPPAAPPVDTPALREALVTLEANRDTPYYSATADAAAAKEYYAGIDDHAKAKDLFVALSKLLDRTHTPRPAYKPLVQVYPWVDLRPDRKLRSIYSGKTFEPEEIMREDARVEALRTTRLQELAAAQEALGPQMFTKEFIALEASLPYNCEHVVPQSSFGAQEPMRGDLHHLFTCESGCNSFRGNTPYFDFQDAEEVVRDACGRREGDRFEPSAGKGAVARATMYFLLRYPGLIGDATRELQAERLPMLLGWHHDEPVSEWELHRNMAIATAQGNRNPLIDHPEWADVLPFELGFGH